ncbi:sensor histidine kinase [Ginsengibacter hankyongi]|uniref:sensor histidine kinase n=1 Tax=Ginsengibacter hankyongi TaxID=2607284 RepID=UPI001927CF5A|nr:sensor histidine kinase [Ginsengibacter hankyongi]
MLSKEILAQEKPFAFNLVTGSKDLTLGKITGITQDKWGYMWFVDQGNNQVERYDGYRMKIFKNNPFDTNSIHSFGLENIAADSSGNVWLPVSGEVDKINSATGIVTHYKLKIAGGDAIIVDHLGVIWIGGSDGLCQFDPKTGKAIYYSHSDKDSTTLSNGPVRVLYEDKEGTIWAGNGFPFVPDKDGGLNKFNRTTGKFVRYTHDPNNPKTLINDKVRAILEDSHGTFWVGTQGDGLHIMDRKTGTFERLTYDPKHPEKLSRPPVKKGDSSDHITFIKEDISGNIWIGTYDEGIERYDPLTKKITHFIADTTSVSGFPDSTTWTAFTSRDGTLWIATETSNLLYRVDPFRKSITHIPTGETANSFVEDKNGYLWVGTEGNGVFKFDQHNNVIAHFIHSPSDPLSPPENHTMISDASDEDKIWSASYNGIRIIDENTNKLYKFSSNSDFFKDSSQYGFVSVLEDKKGVNWFATWGGGLLRYNPKDGSVKQFLPDPKDPASISSNNLNHLLEDRQGRLWVIGGGGVSKMDRKTGKFKNYLPETFIPSIYQDSKNNIWAGTEKGLYLYNEKSDSFSPFFSLFADISTLGIGGIIEDDNHNLWLTSFSSIIKVNPLTKECFIYGEKFGIGKNSLAVWGKSFKNKKGQLCIGNGDGFSIFYPQELEIKRDFKIFLTDFFINSISIVPGISNSIQKPVEEINDLSLKYNQNNLAFNFSAMDYRDPESISYYTMLEGYDNTWRKVLDEKKLQYFNLPQGTFICHIKAFDKDGEQAEKTIIIIVNPPWWQTWWFRISAIVLLAAVIYLVIRWWLSRKFKLQIERSEKEKQLAELNQKATELEMKALRAQMNPHFIFNSLNAINRFILQNNKAHASEFLTKFSRLVRLILQNSSFPLIPLEDEIEALALYLELEALRFDYHFDYQIKVDKDLDVAVIKIPPLIIQPYAENAIWHGLMHKESKGNLVIELYDKGDLLYCKITDDGVGRKKAGELKSKQASTHKSMGMQTTAKRIEMMRGKTEGSAVIIRDLVLPDGTPGGTEVTLKIPLIYD